MLVLANENQVIVGSQLTWARGKKNEKKIILLGTTYKRKNVRRPCKSLSKFMKTEIA